MLIIIVIYYHKGFILIERHTLIWRCDCYICTLLIWINCLPQPI